MGTEETRELYVRGRGLEQHMVEMPAPPTDSWSDKESVSSKPGLTRVLSWWRVSGRMPNIPMITTLNLQGKSKEPRFRDGLRKVQLLL